MKRIAELYTDFWNYIKTESELPIVGLIMCLQIILWATIHQLAGAVPLSGFWLPLSRLWDLLLVPVFLLVGYALNRLSIFRELEDNSWFPVVGQEDNYGRELNLFGAAVCNGRLAALVIGALFGVFYAVPAFIIGPIAVPAMIFASYRVYGWFSDIAGLVQRLWTCARNL